MPASYTKLFSSIVTSTVWQSDPETKIVWITMLALADRHGEVQGSIPGLAHIAGVSLEGCKRALERFQQPDEYSRTKDHEGRRIEEIDGGWALLNYAKYRAMASSDDQMEKNAERQRRHRLRKRETAGTDRSSSVTESNGASRPVTHVTTEAEGDAEADSKPNGLEKRLRAMRLPLDWKPTPAQIEYAKRQGCPNPTETMNYFKEYWGANGKRMIDWNLTWQTWCRRESQFKSRAPQPSQGGFNL
jgi:hypothetical protein